MAAVTFLIGLMLGTIMGFFISALAVAAGRDDREDGRREEGENGHDK